MDLFGRKEKIKSEMLSKSLDNAVKQNTELKKKLSGDRICGDYCKACVNGIETKKFIDVRYPNLGYRIEYTCMLDCKCKDFQKAE